MFWLIGGGWFSASLLAALFWSSALRNSPDGHSPLKEEPGASCNPSRFSRELQDDEMGSDFRHWLDTVSGESFAEYERRES